MTMMGFLDCINSDRLNRVSKIKVSWVNLTNLPLNRI
jgi:hypothetical protein